MKKKFKSLTIISILFILIILIFKNSSKTSETIIFSSNLFIKNVFPSLFPMFIISYVLVGINFPVFLGNLFCKITTKLFKTKKEASFVFFMSMITGFPSNAKNINDLIEKKLISKDEGEKILMFTFFSNPLFIVNTIGGIFLNNIRYGYLILISHILGNIIIGLLFRNYKQSIDNNKINIKNSLKILNEDINNTNIFKIFFNAIKDGLSTLLNIYGIITTFLIIISLFNINYDNIYTSFLIGIIEMTSGLKFISLSNSNMISKILLSCFIISFGGLSVHTQIMNILEDKKIKYLPFFITRILHGIISVIILFSLLLL